MSAAEVLAHVDNVVELVVHTPDGESIRVDPWARIAELEAELERARRDVAHYVSVVKLLCERFAGAEI